MKKVLIFYSKTGGGHLRVAESIAEELKTVSPNTQIILVDGLEESKFNLSFFQPQKAYRLLSNELLWLFNFVYLLTNNPFGSKTLRRLIRFFLETNLQKTVSEHSPDLIISTHHFISPITIGKHSKSVPMVTVVTDLGLPHHMWFDKHASLIITTGEKMAQHARKITGKNKEIVPLDYPIKNHFRKTPLNQKFTGNILVLGGGVGSENIGKQVRELLKHLPDKKIIAVCGYNESLKNKLSQLNNPRLKVYGFVHNMHELIASSDIVVTKAGPATIIEAATLKKPLLITMWVGLQEKDNVDYVLEEKLGVYCPDVKKIPKQVAYLYAHYSDFTKHGIEFNNGALQIAKTIGKLL